jgi:hypothetical protein
MENQIKQSIKKIEDQIAMHDSCSAIVRETCIIKDFQSAFTVTIRDGAAVLEAADSPMQFSPESAKDISELFRSTGRAVEVVFYKDWYRQHLADLKSALIKTEN